MARAALGHHLLDFFRLQREGARKRVDAVTARMGKTLRKDDDREQIVDAALGFEWHNLVYPAESAIFDAAVAGGTKGLQQLSITDNAAIGKAQTLARAYAQRRAAEMVGMKWEGGELLPNPDAQWAISDTTRTKIREAVARAFADEMPIGELGDAIADSGAFSDSRARMIAKTEVTRAQSRGTIAVWKETGAVVTAKWVLSSIHRCCDDCDLNAAAGPVKVGEAYPSGATEPGAHPNCNCALVAVEIRGYAPPAGKPSKDGRSADDLRRELERIDSETPAKMREALYADKPADISYEFETEPGDEMGEWEARAFRDRVDDAVAEFAKIVGDGFLDGQKIRVRYLRRKRAFYFGQAINVHGSTPPEFIVHELGHWLEEDPRVFEAAVAFLERRTEGEEPQSLRELTGIPEFEKDELARPDKFADPYVGKVYESNGTVVLTEVISTGLQWLYEDAAWFAMSDPDYFNFIWNLLRSRNAR